MSLIAPVELRQQIIDKVKRLADQYADKTGSECEH